MRTAIMQPYLLPYVGYFQLINSVDNFVIYDTIKYTKKGWINRNRMLKNGEPITFSVALQKDSDYLDIIDRKISPAFDRNKLLSQIKNTYQGAPEHSTAMSLLSEIINFETDNLFEYIFNSIKSCCYFLGLDKTLLRSSSLEEPSRSLSGVERVIDLCHRTKAQEYINPNGGRDLYQAKQFKKSSLDLKFLKPCIKEYKQFDNPFVGSLSILDVLMFNSRDRIQNEHLVGYSLVE